MVTSQFPLGSDNFSDFSCFWSPVQFKVVLIGYFVECSSIGVCLIFFMVRLQLQVFKKRLQRQSAIFIAPCQGYMLSKWFITWCWPWLPVRSFVCQNLHYNFFSASLYFFFLTSHSPPISDDELCTLSLRKDLHKILVVLLHGKFDSSPIFIYYWIILLILWPHVYLFYSLDYSPILLHCSNCLSLASESSFSGYFDVPLPA